METLTINLFYPLLFTVIVVLIVTVGCVLVKCKDNNLFGNIFNKSSDNTKEITLNTTDKLSKAHTEIVEVKWDEAHEKEMHRLEVQIREIIEKLDMLIKRVSILEQDRNK